MGRQIGERYQEEPVSALDERVRMLENRVTNLSEVIRVLVHGLEDLPAAEPGQRPAVQAARRAYELLLIAEPQRGSGPGAGDTAT